MDVSQPQPQRLRKANCDLQVSDTRISDMGHQMGFQPTGPIMATTEQQAFLSTKILTWLKISPGGRGWYSLPNRNISLTLIKEIAPECYNSQKIDKTLLSTK